MLFLFIWLLMICWRWSQMCRNVSYTSIFRSDQCLSFPSAWLDCLCHPGSASCCLAAQDAPSSHRLLWWCISAFLTGTPAGKAGWLTACSCVIVRLHSRFSVWLYCTIACLLCGPAFLQDVWQWIVTLKRAGPSLWSIYNLDSTLSLKMYPCTVLLNINFGFLRSLAGYRQKYDTWTLASGVGQCLASTV